MNLQHERTSLQFSSVETLNIPAHIFVYFLCLFLFLLIDAKRTKNSAQRKKPNLVLFMVERERKTERERDRKSETEKGGGVEGQRQRGG